MSDNADRLTQALRDLIKEAVQAAVKRATPPPERVVERPKVPDQDFDLCPWCNKKHMRRHLHQHSLRLPTTAAGLTP